MPPLGQRVERVVLTESETIVERGHRRVVWFIQDGHRWSPAARWPGVSILDENPGPGTIWVRHLEVNLAPGHLLLRVESRPAARRTREVLDFLRRETRLAERETKRTRYRVARGGKMLRASGD